MFKVNRSFAIDCVEAAIIDVEGAFEFVRRPPCIEFDNPNWYVSLLRLARRLRTIGENIKSTVHTEAYSVWLMMRQRNK